MKEMPNITLKMFELLSNVKISNMPNERNAKYHPEDV